eukprot:s526_g3.t1
MRFTKQDGDLATFSGRQKLWSWIERYQPEHIWMAPECGPWGGWNHLNKQKSQYMFDMIQSKQDQQLPHAKLCVRICQYQTRLNRHFHLEQPAGSGLPHLKIFEPILSKTVVARFDMCQFGLRIPKTNKFLRKSSQLLTSSRQMFHVLHGRKCADQHDHQRIEGSVRIHGFRQRLPSFCATYCSGFARMMARTLCLSPHTAVGPDEHALVFHDEEDERPQKRPRLDHSRFKRLKVSHDAPIEPPSSVVADGAKSSDHAPRDPNPSVEPANAPMLPPHASEPWKAVMDAALKIAPRVGNARCSADSEMWSLAQELVKDSLKISDMFVCRGTEKFQVPLHAPPSHQFPLRYTVCMHRETSEIFDFGIEDWHQKTRAQRIRKNIPSKLTITLFGSAPNNESAHVPVPAPVPDASFDEVKAMTEPMSAVRASGHIGLPTAVHARTSNVACEGWAPPPVPLHGPKFRLLNDREKQDLIKLHKNLGHPNPLVLSQHLHATGAPEHIVEAAKEYICDACVETTKFSHQRPAKLHEPKEFNELVGIDGFYWTGRAGFQVMVFHCIDEASLFHLGRRISNRHLEHVVPTFLDMWSSWAGHPQGVYSDPAGEFRADQWLTFLQEQNIEPRLSTEAWQKGRVERHGQIIKNMLNRFDQEKIIGDPQELDEVLRACFQAKNALSRNQGYSPEQIVLGKATRLPASLTSDDQVAAHSLADGNTLESERFRQNLETRSRARKMFLLADNDAAIRRAILRKSNPLPGPYTIGQTVMYWRKKNVGSRREVGRWHGPGRVVLQDGSTTIWVSHGDRLLRCAPENLRPASLREWNGSSESLDQAVQDVQRFSSSRSNPIPEDRDHDDEMYTPGTPVEQADPPLSVQTSIQPESEAFPDQLDSTFTTPVQTPQHESPADPPTESAHPFQDETAIDLDPENNPPFETAETENVLTCHTLENEDVGQSIYEWNVFHAGEDTAEVCLAEDGMPYLEEPLMPHEHQCFMLEVPMSRQDIIHWSQAAHPEELAQVASASKRARAEVQLKDLSAEDRKLFSAAKEAELSCWLQTSALKPVLRKHLNPEQILKSRWVLTWKSVPENDGAAGSRKAKARLVVLGYQDPRLTEVSRDAPTLSREGRHTVLQLIASQHWVLTSFDIKTAFLRGKADSNNPLAMEPPKELRDRMQLDPNQVCALIGNAYGRVDAPLLFYKELSKQLQTLGFKVHPLEPCVYYLETWKGDQRTLHGVLGTHVDDGICGGDSWFHSRIELLREQLPFGSYKQRKFVFTGIQLEQLPDFSIRANQGDYVHAIPCIEIGKHRRSLSHEPVTESEMTCLRGLIGSLQYATTHTRPDMAAKLGEIQVQLSKPTVSTLLEANKVLREAKETSDVNICFRAIDPQELTHVVFGDASFASPKQLSSFQGTMVFATTPSLQQNQKAPISPLSWSSKKISRVVRSTLSAEAFSMSRSVDKMGWCRLLWGTLVIPQFNWRTPPVAFGQLHAAVIVTDCKSLYDLVSRRAMPSCEEYRTTLEVLLIKERCLEHCIFRWIPTALQLADPLTKNMDSTLLRAALEQGSFQLFDEAASLQANAHRKQAIQWLRESHQQSFQGV